ncbi:hypothetical protein N7467_006659 [Penicillium canescens]|nr:hypothetical protein N7467_006659 [Penicillium canescens]
MASTSNIIPSSASPTAVDVVVVGAGLSGLRAALAIQAAGLSCAVVEATDRVGGKTLTLQFKAGPGVNDLGAAWINDTSQSEMHKLVQRYRLQTVAQMDTGFDVHLHGDEVVVCPHGVLPLEEEEQLALGQVFEACKELNASISLDDPASGRVAKELDSLSFHDYCLQTFQSESIADLFNMISQSLIGIESKDISALSFFHSCKSGTGLENMISDGKNGGQYLRLREGAQSISMNMAKEFKAGSLHLSTPVTEIKQSTRTRRCIVRSSNGTVVEAKKVIISVATPLPRSHPLFGGVDTSVPDDDQWSISSFIVGGHGIEWSRLSEEERRSSAWTQLYSAFKKVKLEFGQIQITDPINVLEFEWTKQEFFHGVPCPASPPGLLSSIDGTAIREPFGNVHFVGTETALEWKGYMEGAVRSGDRGAEEIVAVLREELI